MKKAVLATNIFAFAWSEMPGNALTTYTFKAIINCTPFFRNLPKETV